MRLPARGAACAAQGGDRGGRVGAGAGGAGGSDEVEYHDTWLDMAFIGMLRLAYGRLAGWQSPAPWWTSETYDGLVDVSRALMRGRSAAEQLDVVVAGFPRVPPLFRRLFPYSRWGAEANAWLTLNFFQWLVGPVERREKEVNGVLQSSTVYIKKCRYLETSQCNGMCVNLCKSPCETFFREQLGMPLTMVPNFEDGSCEMIFGQTPPPREEDPAFSQPCAAACPSAPAVQSQAPCRKMS